MTSRHGGGRVYAHTSGKEEAVKKQHEEGLAGGAAVNATPLGVPNPAAGEGWQVVYADAFGVPIGLGAGEDNTWYPNRPNNNPAPNPTSLLPGDNGNELQVYSSSQVSVNAEGLRLTCLHSTNVGGTGKDYVSGTIRQIAQNYGSYKPFGWKPTVGQAFAHEIVCQLPANTKEMNPSFWSVDSPWTAELDHPEWWGWPTACAVGDYQAGMPVWIYRTPTKLTEAEESQEKSVRHESFHQSDYGSFNPEGSLHRYCTVYNKDGSLSMYIDGIFKWDVAAPAQSLEVRRPMLGLVVQCALRRPKETVYTTAPNFTSGERSFIIRSVATYTNEHLAAQNVRNPGVVTGTTIQ